MSPQVDNFVHSLVEMARAQEMLPQVEAERDSFRGMLNDALDTVQSRELAIIAYKQEIEALHSRIRSLEVERDDASFRVLESEDLAHKALSFAKQAETAAAAVMSLLDPPKPEPAKEPEEGSSEENPSPKNHGQDQDANSQTAPVSGNALLTNAVHSIEETTSGQSEGGPTVNTGLTQMDAGSPPATSTDVGSTTTETSPVEPTSGPYSGKRYFDHPTYVPLHDWLAGGGTEENYLWRPSHPGAAISH